MMESPVQCGRNAHAAPGFFLFVGRIDPVEYVGVSQQRNGDVRNINHPLCGCATLVIQKITFPL